jgi:hypothetical protein
MSNFFLFFSESPPSSPPQPEKSFFPDLIAEPEQQWGQSLHLQQLKIQTFPTPHYSPTPSSKFRRRPRIAATPVISIPLNRKAIKTAGSGGIICKTFKFLRRGVFLFGRLIGGFARRKRDDVEAHAATLAVS